MYKKICKNPQCKETFFTNIKNKQYCSKECRIDYQEFKTNYRLDPGTGQMCWRCANACGGCSWSRDYKPVKGWKAIRVAVKHRGELEFYSYRIIFCPQFKKDVECRPFAEYRNNYSNQKALRVHR